MKRKKVAVYTYLILGIILCLSFAGRFLPFDSYGVDDTKVIIESKLDKYINYVLSEENKGTLVQYNIKTQIEYGKEDLATKQREIIVNFSQIDGQYPNQAKIINTNMDKEGISQYDERTGTLQIQTNNQNEKEEYVIVVEYNTYTEEKKERELETKITAKVTLDQEENRQVNSEEQYQYRVTENIGELTSVKMETHDIYNGYIKSNIINGTNYTTQYEQKDQIIVSKKEAQDSIEMQQNNTFIKIHQNENQEDVIEELGNDKKLVYNSTKMAKENIQEILGEEFVVEVFDIEGNVIATINQETEFDENGIVSIVYENETEHITLKTSKIQKEGILLIENTKEIKDSMVDVSDVKIKTDTNIIGTNQETLETPNYRSRYENIVDIQDSQTKVNVKIDNTNWTNQQQNEVTFEISLKANTIQQNMFKNPNIKIELPSQVEKVILQNSSIFHANGLQLENTYIETNESGNKVIVADLKGQQMEYSENTLELGTDIKVSATVILRKDLENTEEIAKLIYMNQYTIDGGIEIGTKEVPLQIESYQEESMTTLEEIENYYDVAGTTVTNVDGLKLEVAAEKGDSSLTDGDTIHEGEFIKYNVKVTNTSKLPIENVRIIGNIPEGTIYGELIADYYKETKDSFYQFDDSITSKEIEIGTLEAGEVVSKFYEVQVNDMEEGKEEKQIHSSIKAYVGEAEVKSYEINNVLKPAEAKILLTAFLGLEKDYWTYHIDTSSKEEEQATVKLKLPKEFKVSHLSRGDKGIEMDKIASVSEDNIMTINVDTNMSYYVGGLIDRSKLVQETEEAKQWLMATASVILEDGSIYQSNENRILYEYQAASISMKSDKEGEEVAYKEEIDYTVTITNTGRTNLGLPHYSNAITVNLTDFLPEYVDPISVTYDNWEEELNVTDDESGGFQSTGKFYKLDPVTKDISGIFKDNNGNKLPSVDLYVTIPYQESVTVVIKATAGFVYEKTKIENSATITSNQITAKTSNVVMHTILPYNYVNNPGIPDNPDTPDKPDTPDNPNIPDNPNETYSIAGVTWIDENEDGQRQTNEGFLSGITVMLVDTKNGDQIKDRVQTNANGSYSFSNLARGDYIVLFQYDTNNYHLTEYQKNGVTNNLNSDAIGKEMILNGENIKVGMIEVADLKASVSNRDAGFIKNKVCDLKLEKTIKKITVSTRSGSKEYTYPNVKLAKIEIKAKEIEGATVTIEYNIVVTNEGELPATVSKVIDYLPEGLTVSSENDRNWVLQANGQLLNMSTSNQKIEPGQKKELTLVATKQMTANNTGTFTNSAKIGDITNALNIVDNKLENNYDKADVIISVSTGIIFYISITIILVLIVGGVVFLISKYGILKTGKTSLFVIIFMTILVSSMGRVEAIPDMAIFEYDHHGENPHRNEEGKRDYFFAHTAGTGDALCIEPERATAASNLYSTCSRNPEKYKDCTIDHRANYNFWEWSNIQDYKSYISKENILFTMTNDSDKAIRMKKIESDYIVGPFDFYCDYAGWYIWNIEKPNGEKMKNVRSCDVNGNIGGFSGNVGNITFYLRIPASECRDGISKVEVSTTRTGEAYEIVTFNAQAKYYAGENVQKIKTINSFDSTESKYAGYKSLTQTVMWTNFCGSLDITKTDKDDSNVKLSGVQFRITGPYNYDQTFVTNVNGDIHIDNLPAGTYNIVEVSNPYYGYTVRASDSIQVQGAKTESKVVPNEKQTGNLKIKKVDKDSGEPLTGVTFTIKNAVDQYIRVKDKNGNTQGVVTGSIYVGGISTTSNENEATKFITDSKGCIEIRNILAGEYTVIETSIGDNAGYEIDGSYISWESSSGSGTGNNAQVTVKRCAADKTKEDSNLTEADYCIITIKNKRKYIDLSGYVWEDLPWQEGKEWKTDELYNENSDKLIKDMVVELKDDKGNIVDLKDDEGNILNPIQTDSNGKYEFKKIEIDKLKDYYIEFQYNGMSYENVTFKPEIAEGSKATEGKSREKFNNDYATISYGESNAYKLEYDTKTQIGESRLLYGDTANYNYGYAGNEENRDPIHFNGVENQYVIKANTQNAYEGNLNKIYSEEYIRENGMTEIENINLGIKKRQKVDLSVIKDIYSVKVSINETEQVYRYADRFNSTLSSNYDELGRDRYNMDPQVKFGEKYGNKSYTRALYASDIYYKGDNQSKNLKVEVTYKIGIRNITEGIAIGEEGITTTINEVTDYYDDKYQNIKAGKEVENDGTIIESSSYQTIDQGTEGNYKKVKIETNLETKHEEENSFYVQLEVIPDRIVEILGDRNDTVKLDNMVEISSYSGKDKEGKPYATIDKDSQPGNLKIEDNIHEDDTDKAPGLKLVLQEERKLEGMVFVDQTGELATGEIRQGDGLYNNREDSVIEGVKVKLVKTANGETAQVYNRNNKEGEKWEDAEATTKADGTYTITGFIPDNYQIVYTWGGQTYIDQQGQEQLIRVQEYKNTVVNETVHSAKNNNSEWYKDEFKKNYSDIEWNVSQNQEIRVSDALDNYQKRLTIDEQMSIMTNRNKTVINNYSGQLEQRDGNKETITTEIDSTTPNFKVNVEYSTTPTSSEEEYELDENGEVKLDGIYAVKKEEYKNHLKSIDFGVVERAKQILKLEKDVRNVKVTLANGVVLIDAEIKDGKIVNDVKHIAYIPDSSINGQIKMEVDSEILQGAQLEIHYGLKIRNISELDYKNQEYYFYGRGHGQKISDLIELDTKEAMDYLDNDISVDPENPLGTILQDKSKKNELIEKQLLENTTQIKEQLENTQKVLIIDKLSEKLKPEGIEDVKTSTEVILETYKLLSNTSTEEGIELDNIAEIIKVEKTGGAPVLTIPGNYEPGATPEYDNDTAETVIIVPPTGLNTDYIAYMLLTISSLGILVSGIILIKKTVLK